MHEHEECKHVLKYCKKCDAVYCEKCKKEWFSNTITVSSGYKFDQDTYTGPPILCQHV